MLSRKKSFKKWFLIIFTINTILFGADLILVMNNPSYFTPEETIQTIGDFVGVILVTIIWSTYLWKSKNAKNTFVK